jgi:hypothetical protein
MTPTKLLTTKLYHASTEEREADEEAHEVEPPIPGEEEQQRIPVLIGGRICHHVVTKQKQQLEVQLEEWPEEEVCRHVTKQNQQLEVQLARRDIDAHHRAEAAYIRVLLGIVPRARGGRRRGRGGNRGRGAAAPQLNLLNISVVSAEG